MPGVFNNHKIEALAMLYLQKQDLKNMSPEDLYDLYVKTYNRINHRKEEIESAKA